MNKKTFFTLAAASFLAQPLSAQTIKAGQVELGAYSTFTKYDDAGTTLDKEVGSTGTLGIFLSSVFSLEALGSYSLPRVANTTNTEVGAALVGGTLLANFSYGGGSFFLGAGYERVFYRGALQADENGVHALLGNRFSLGGRATLRIQGTAAYFPSATLIAGQSTALNLGASAGLSVFAFGGQPRDSDEDGVANRTDQCADTPTGALVDTLGCPSDSDTDGVWDGLDQCAATPQGAITDMAGCPSDPDADGVFVGIDVCPDTPAGATVDPNGCPLDSDADSVFDGLDVCPDTPEGATIDASGCPSDEDSDTVLDGLDQCVGTPLGVTVDASGCPADTDGDGVLDDIDACPNTVAGTPVDANGCRFVTDTDGDGVEDTLDRCPNTIAGRNVDVNGCPVLFEVTQGQAARPLILQGVNFRSGRATLRQSSFVVLDQVAASLIANPTVRIEIVGHTDNTGSRGGNITISMRRADAVRTYLMSKGVSADRLVSQGAGPDEPISTNRTAEGRAQNRRVELRLISR